MASIKKIIGSFIHAPDRFDLLADRIADVRRDLNDQCTELGLRFDDVGGQIEDVEDAIDEKTADWFVDRICEHPELLSRLKQRLDGEPEAADREPEKAAPAAGTEGKKAEPEPGKAGETEPDYPEGTQLNIPKIMEEIRAEARRWEPAEGLPAFEDLSTEDLHKCARLRKRVEKLTEGYEIPIIYEDPSHSPLKRFYKRIAKKAVRCATAPMSVKITETNLNFRTALERAIDVIEEQEKRISELEKAIQK